MNRYKIRIIIIASFLFILTFVLSGCSWELSDIEAVEIINEKLNINISIDSLNVVSTYYVTNIREYSFLIVADIECPDINEIAHTLQLTQTDLSELVKEGMSNELTSILNKYLDYDTLLYCRYENDRLLNGKEHPASVYLICLSEEGRLILWEDI